MVDNFEQIRSMLEFRSQDDFYFLQILQRKKDVKPDSERKVAGSNNNSRLIKYYTVHSLEYFNKIEKEVKELCNLFYARAGINLNRRSYERTSLQLLKKVTDQILNKDYQHAMKAYSSVCGAHSNESSKKWILDIDDCREPNRFHNEMILFAERECRPEGNKFISTIPSKSGFHIIMNPFDLSKFKKKYPGVDIHKDNPTGLYIP